MCVYAHTLVVIILEDLQIYQSSLGSGPESIQTVGGLFHLGEVFLKENKPSVALSFFEKVR